MSFFDDVFLDDQEAQAHASDLDVQTSFAAIAIAVSACDGSVGDVEIENAVTYLRRMRLFADYSTQQFIGLFGQVISILKREGPKHLVENAAEHLSTELKQTAFALSLDVALADGVVDDAERDMIAFVRKTLGIDDALAVQITEVMIIKNRG